VVSVALILASAAPSRAARPLLDSGKWNAYFALFARDTQVPWKRIGVRLDTYSGAAVDFAAYAVDPADVLVAGANARPRAIDTSHRTPVARWRFTPPAGLKFESNDVEVPLRNREGFFVIEARRGSASQQVWVNLSRIGILTKESPRGIVLYAADLGSGRALPGMRITYLVGAAFAYGKTDAHGVARVAGPRPRFALAEWGASRAFVNFVPVPPTPAGIVGIRLDRGVVHAGEHVAAVGFARVRRGGEMRAATGNVKLVVVARGRTLFTAQPKLDAAGAFSSDIPIPADASSADVAVLASAGGATGGASLRIEAVGDANLTIAPSCGSDCPADADIPVTVSVQRDGLPQSEREVHVRVVRTPHVLAPGTPDDAAQWATTAVLDERVRTDATGVAQVTLPAPGDELASTYGITAESGTATASARLVTPTAKIALAVSPERTPINIGEAAIVDVRGFDALDGTPAAGTPVELRLIHGPNIQQTTVTLDTGGRGRATFRDVMPGTSLVTATATGGGRAFDASAVAVEPSATAAGGGGASGEVRIDFDHDRYRVNARIGVSGELAGATGDAFVSLDGVRSFGTAVVPIRAGKAEAALTVPAAVGDVEAGVAFVRDGALYYGTRTVTIDGPGHPRETQLHADQAAYAPGATAKISIADGGIGDGATIAVRLGDGIPASGADFVDAPDSLAAAGTTSQNPASDDPAWHAWVAPVRSTAGDIFGFDRPRVADKTDTTLAVAAPRALFWRIDANAGGSIDVPLPQEKGKYVLSILKVAADGDVGAATISLIVQ
jgi:uncharacterized protein YfaS (alpha-2-macroglobulin family)